MSGEVFNLVESHTILRYLAATRGTPDHWYPLDPVKRAKVDMYLDQHHSFLRAGLTYSVVGLINPRTTGEPFDSAAFKKSHSILRRALDDLESRLSRHAFLCSDEVSISDLSAACELD